MIEAIILLLVTIVTWLFARGVQELTHVLFSYLCDQHKPMEEQSRFIKVLFNLNQVSVGAVGGTLVVGYFALAYVVFRLISILP